MGCCALLPTALLPGDLSGLGIELKSLTPNLHWQVNSLAPPRKPTFYYTRSVKSVQSLSRVQLFATPWTEACQASLSIINSRSLLKLMSIELAVPSNHLILCCPLLLLRSIFCSIRVFSNESVLHIRWPKYWSFSFIISPSNEYSGLISFRIDCLDLLQSKGLSRILSNTSVQKHQFFSTQLSLQSNSKGLLKISVSVCAQ